MDAIFIDRYGNRKNFLYQFDKGQTLVVEDVPYESAPKVQYSISVIPNTITVQSSIANGVLTASIPDAFLYSGEDIIAYIYVEDSTSGQTVDAVYISVRERKKPSNFVFDEEVYPFVHGTHTIPTSVWSAASNEINELKDGLTIRYWLPCDSIGPASLNFTFMNNGTSVELPCYSYGSHILDEYVPAGSVMFLTYRNGVPINGSEETYTGWWLTYGAGASIEFVLDEDGVLYLSKGMEEVM